MLAAAELVSRDDEFLLGVPAPSSMPDLDVTAIQRLIGDGKFPTGFGVSEEDVLTARAFSSSTSPTPGPDPNPGSTGVRDLGRRDRGDHDARSGRSELCPGRSRVRAPRGCPAPERAATPTIRTERRGDIVARLEDAVHRALSRPRTIPVRSDQAQRIQLSHDGLVLHLEVPVRGDTTLCGNRRPPSCVA